MSIMFVDGAEAPSTNIMDMVSLYVPGFALCISLYLKQNPNKPNNQFPISWDESDAIEGDLLTFLDGSFLIFLKLG